MRRSTMLFAAVGACMLFSASACEFLFQSVGDALFAFLCLCVSLKKKRRKDIFMPAMHTSMCVCLSLSLSLCSLSFSLSWNESFRDTSLLAFS